MLRFLMFSSMGVHTSKVIYGVEPSKLSVLNTYQYHNFECYKPDKYKF